MNEQQVNTQEQCNCWVANQPVELQFVLRYGAHDGSCPKYRQSVDPVDRYEDGLIRQEFTKKR